MLGKRKWGNMFYSRTHCNSSLERSLVYLAVLGTSQTLHRFWLDNWMNYKHCWFNGCRNKYILTISFMKLPAHCLASSRHLVHLSLSWRDKWIFAENIIHSFYLFLTLQPLSEGKKKQVVCFTPSLQMGRVKFVCDSPKATVSTWES